VESAGSPQFAALIFRRMTPPLLLTGMDLPCQKPSCTSISKAPFNPRLSARWTARHGVIMTRRKSHATLTDFGEFIEAFKWVTSFLREPTIYALIAGDLAEHLLTHAWSMRNNFVRPASCSLETAPEQTSRLSPRHRTIRKSGTSTPMGVRCPRAIRRGRSDGSRRIRKRCHSKAIVAFGIGGDELSFSTKEFVASYDPAAQLVCTG